MLAACDWSQGVLQQPEYWIWAGILPEDAPDAAEILVYQGNFLHRDGRWQFEHKGVHAHPLSRQRIQLVFRMHELPEPAFVDSVVRNYIAGWRRHDVTVTGVQLDFDSPSAALEHYATFLAAVRGLIPGGLEYSITGLGAWLAESDPASLAMLHSEVDYIAYQFYVGRQPLDRPQQYIRFLQRNSHRFKVGLLASHPRPDGIEALASNPAFGGTIHFLQR